MFEAVSLLGGGFDLVYSTVGTVMWLPSIGRWAEQVAGLLRPGGRLYLRDLHPILFSVDETRMPGEVVLRYPYSEASGPVTFEEVHSYTGEGLIEHSRTYEWNHSAAEIVSALISADLQITAMADERTMEWSFYEGQPEVAYGRFACPPSWPTSCRSCSASRPSARVTGTASVEWLSSCRRG